MDSKDCELPEEEFLFSRRIESSQTDQDHVDLLDREGRRTEEIASHDSTEIGSKENLETSSQAGGRNLKSKETDQTSSQAGEEKLQSQATGSEAILRSIQEIIANKDDERGLTDVQINKYLKFLRDLFEFVGSPNEFCGFYGEGGIRFKSKPLYKEFEESFGKLDVVDEVTGAVLVPCPIPAKIGTSFDSFKKDLKSFNFQKLPRTRTAIYVNPDFNRVNPDLRKMVLGRKLPSAPATTKVKETKKKGAATGSGIASSSTSAPSACIDGDIKNFLLEQTLLMRSEVASLEQGVATLKGRLSKVEDVLNKMP